VTPRRIDDPSGADDYATFSEEDGCSYWATHQGAELDLLVTAGGRRLERSLESERTVVAREDEEAETVAARFDAADGALDPDRPDAELAPL
jgi:hypothetical protein